MYSYFIVRLIHVKTNVAVNLPFRLSYFEPKYSRQGYAHGFYSYLYDHSKSKHYFPFLMYALLVLLVFSLAFGRRTFSNSYGLGKRPCLLFSFFIGGFISRDSKFAMIYGPAKQKRNSFRRNERRKSRATTR